MPSFLSQVRGTSSATLFEIRLENDIIVLRGSESEASSQLLKGTLVLCLPSPLKVEDVHLRLKGECKVGWNDQKMTATGISNNRMEKTTEIFNHLWPKFVGGDGPGSSSKGLTLQPGNYEWPFEIVLPGSTAESVEGLIDSHITYKLKATVARGKFAYDLHVAKPIRIVRTLDPAALELSHAMTVENIWPNKIEYSMVIPQKAIVFGTVIQIDMKFTSLLKGLTIGAIKCYLIESQEFTLPGMTLQSADRYFKNSREIGNWTFEMNEDEHYQDVINDETGQSGYVLSKQLPLPKSLRKCLQDVETHGIKIRHKVKFNIALHNPDGHTSELRATLPVTIFISPNMPIDEAGELLDQTPNSVQSTDIGAHAPPLYGEHVLDQLYADFDNSGLLTPMPQSGMSTPFYSQSRSGSNENLSSMDGIASNAIRPDALSHRLQNLAANNRNSSFLRHHGGNGSGSNTPHGNDDLHHGHGSNASLQNIASALPRVHSGYFDPPHHSNSSSQPHSAPASNPLSRRTSEEDQNITSALTSGVHTPEHLDYSDMGDLTKVPSYSTAVKTPARGMSYTDLESLPNYEVAISRPPSPVQATTPGTGAHGLDNGYFGMAPNGRSSTTPGLEMDMSGSARRSHMAGIGMTPLNGAHAVSQDADANRRLHLLQARGRAH